MNPLTAEDFASVPWGGMAVHENGRKSVRIPEKPYSRFCWVLEGDRLGCRDFRSDKGMADEGGWTIPDVFTRADLEQAREETVGRMMHLSRSKCAKLNRRITGLGDTIADQSATIERLQKDLATGIRVTTAREALETLTDEEWGRMARAADDWAHGRPGRPGDFRTVITNALSPMPEPWETAPFVIWDDDGGTFIAARDDLPDGPVWYATGSTEPLTRHQVAAMNPRPFDPREVA